VPGGSHNSASGTGSFARRRPLSGESLCARPVQCLRGWPQDRRARTTPEDVPTLRAEIARLFLAGWVELGDRALVSGNCVAHQYTRIGRLAMMRGLSRTSRDVPPFCIMDGTHTLRGINK
jgi:hypothetical protein